LSDKLNRGNKSLTRILHFNIFILRLEMQFGFLLFLFVVNLILFPKMSSLCTAQNETCDVIAGEYSRIFTRSIERILGESETAII
jgi:hypothetical protein